MKIKTSHNTDYQVTKTGNFLHPTFLTKSSDNLNIHRVNPKFKKMLVND